MPTNENTEISKRYGRYAAHAPPIAESFVRADAAGPDALDAWLRDHGFASRAEADAWIHDQAARSWLAWRKIMRRETLA